MDASIQQTQRALYRGLRSWPAAMLGVAWMAAILAAAPSSADERSATPPAQQCLDALRRVAQRGVFWEYQSLVAVAVAELRHPSRSALRPAAAGEASPAPLPKAPAEPVADTERRFRVARRLEVEKIRR